MAKHSGPRQFQKLIKVMISGNIVTLEEFEALLGKEIHMYKIPSIMWDIKYYANGVIKTIKDPNNGRKAIGYQLINTDEMRKYLHRVGLLEKDIKAGPEKKPTKAKVAIKSLSELNAVPQPAVVEQTQVEEVCNA